LIPNFFLVLKFAWILRIIASFPIFAWTNFSRWIVFNFFIMEISRLVKNLQNVWCSGALLVYVLRSPTQLKQVCR